MSPARKKGPSPKLITQAAYARRRGVTKQAVGLAVAGDRIRLVDGLVDPEQADRDWAANTDPAKQVRKKDGAPRGPGYGSYSPVRKERELVDLQIRKLALLKESQAVVSAEVYDRLAYNRNRAAVKMLLAVDARLGPELAGISDPAECRRRIRREMELVVRQIGDLATGKAPRKGSK